MARRQVKAALEARLNRLIEDARKHAETRAEDAKSFFYLHQETGEAFWEVPSIGYTRVDGMLVLATGQVIEDPLLKMTDEERRLKALETLCCECEKNEATRLCAQCGDKFCTNCYNDTHSTGKRATHSWTRLGMIECAECEQNHAKRWCVLCDDPFCLDCWDNLHRRGKRAQHQFCTIDDEGKLNPEAVLQDGRSTGEVYSIGPADSGGGDPDGEDGTQATGGGAAATPQPSEYASGEGYTGDEQQAQSYGVDTNGSEWAEYQDEQGNPYSFNNVTGETTYDPPASQAASTYSQHVDEGGVPYWYNATTGDSTYEDPSGAGGSVEHGGTDAVTVQSSGWQEYADESGHPYWHNELTGESTYENPTG